MIYKTDKEIFELVKKFEDCTVTASEWTHAAHLTAALMYAVNHDFEPAHEKMRSGIFKLNEAHGTPNTETRGYHETLTIFWLKTVFDYLENRSPRVSKGGSSTPHESSPPLLTRGLLFGAPNFETSLFNLANDLIETCGDSSLPLKFYSRETLFSPAARAKYIEPDLSNYAQISQ